MVCVPDAHWFCWLRTVNSSPVLGQELCAHRKHSKTSASSFSRVEGYKNIQDLPQGVHIQLCSLFKEGKRSVHNICNSCPDNAFWRGDDLSLGPVVLVLFSTLILKFVNKLYLTMWFWLSLALDFLYKRKLPVFLFDSWSLQEMTRNLWQRSRVASLLWILRCPANLRLQWWVMQQQVPHHNCLFIPVLHQNSHSAGATVLNRTWLQQHCTRPLGSVL